MMVFVTTLIFLSRVCSVIIPNCCGCYEDNIIVLSNEPPSKQFPEILLNFSYQLCMSFWASKSDLSGSIAPPVFL